MVPYIRIIRDLRLTRTPDPPIEKCQRISFLCKGIHASIAYIPSHRDGPHRIDFQPAVDGTKNRES